MAKAWTAIVLAAGRGPNDPMAKAYGISHKCALPVNGVPMLRRVVNALQDSQSIAAIGISIERPAIVREALAEKESGVSVIPSENSAPLSAIVAIKKNATFPVLITTGDHALLTPEMVDYFCEHAQLHGADFSAGLARAEVIMKAYPQSVRTFFRFGKDRVSGCNLFAIANENGLRILEKWQYLEQSRKKPWRLVAAFGPLALIRFAVGALSLDGAFSVVSKRLGVTARPVLMPFAEAAIDVDKPSDLELAEAILKLRN
ncbi:MAG TPA: nucleotidyltransferase family protein [Aestuariivirga sp.]|nr:nucleotidyltransferase family protein [Aestuariivirga sp.]